MKKIAVVILLTVSLVLLFTSGTASASGEAFAFELSSSSVLTFRECPVILSFSANPGISAGALNITYDYTKVSLKRYETADGFSADIVSVVDNKYGQIRFAFLSSTGPVYDTGEVLKLYFVSSSLTPCASDIKVTQSTNAVYNDEYASAGYTCTAGKATFISSELWLAQGSSYNIDFDKKIITGVVPGTAPATFTANFGGNFKLVYNGASVGTGAHLDANFESYYILLRGDVTGDGAIGVMDYISLRLSLLGISPLAGVYSDAADVDSSGKLSVTDYILLRLHILGISDLYRHN